MQHTPRMPDRAHMKHANYAHRFVVTTVTIY